jgi:hypothetical protein
MKSHVNMVAMNYSTAGVGVAGMNVAVTGIVSLLVA